MIIGELTWQQFKSLDSIRNLTESKQVQHYYEYLTWLENQYNHQNKGKIPTGVITCVDGMDIVFLVDYTGSMGSAINAIKAAIASIVSTIVAESANNYRLSLVLFDEYTSGTTSNYSNKTAYTSLPSSQKYVNTGLNSRFQWITAMEVFSQNNESSFSTQLALLNDSVNFPLGSGIGTPEPADMGIDRIVNFDLVGTFRSDVSKLIILITDAPSSGNDDVNNATDVTFANTIAADCIAKGIKVLLMKPNSNSVAPLETIATETGGLVSESFTPTSIITSIENICT
jgi:hypothetical protein